MVPCASATPATVRAMRSFRSCRTRASSVRIVPRMVTASAMMLWRLPPWMDPMVSTLGFWASICRETTSWRACTISAAMGMGSMPVCGYAPWVLRPTTSMAKVSEDAKIGPIDQPTSPTGSAGSMCSP